MRSVSLGWVAVAMALSGVMAASAQEARRASDAGAAHGHEARQEQGLESIADEVAEVAGEGTEQSGMSRAMQETIDTQNEEVCPFNQAATCDPDLD